MSQSSSSSSASDQNHIRINNTLLGRAEKQALLWLAAHMPAWVVPDTLTLLGLSASLLIFVSYALTIYNPAFLWLASFGFLFQWLGDSLDGTLARFRHIERPRYGFFVDHIIDSVSEVLIFLGLGLSPYLRFDLAMLALTGYLLMSTYVYLVTYVNGIFRISYGRLGPTEMRLLAVVANTVVFFAGRSLVQVSIAWPVPFQAALTFYDLVAMAFVLLMGGIFTASTLTTAMQLSREDRAASQAARRARAHEAKANRDARRQALRDERQMRKNAAKSAQVHVEVGKD